MKKSAAEGAIQIFSRKESVKSESKFPLY